MYNLNKLILGGEENEKRFKNAKAAKRKIFKSRR